MFLGSEDYPYKGVLDLLANRCLSNGTNAYTDTDHTNYTLSTAGSDGFLQMLPIYLDHLLFPTLTDTGYVTEVHHINGDGEDAGVVYCEMQARENTGEERCYLEMLRSMYPGKCGYKSQTGGILKNLRESTNNEKVRNYHKEFYRCQNLCVVVTGAVEPEAIFAAIKPIEDKIVQKQLHKVSFTRPWQNPVSCLEESVDRRIQYASETDDDGLVYIGFRGPNVMNDYRQLVAVSVLLDYLNSTAISPIQRDFVECPEPYCSSVEHHIIENSTSMFYLTFESVGKKYLDLVHNRLFTLLRKIKNLEESIDMDRMSTIISRKIVRILSTAESSPHAVAIGPIIGHYLYGTSDIKSRCQEIPSLREFAKMDSSFWLSILDKYFVGQDARHVCIVGEPSPCFMKTTTEAEKARVEKQKEELKDDLAMIAEKLKRSNDENNRPAPASMLASVRVPSIDNIKFFPIERNVVPKEAGLPFRLHHDSIKTNFITIHTLFNTSTSITKQQRLYLPLLAELIFESPILRDGKLVPYEQVVAQLFSETVVYHAGIGVSGTPQQCGSASMMFQLVMQVEIERYENAVRRLNEAMYSTVFTPERIKTVATRIVSDISQCKRSGSKVAGAISKALTYQSNSNVWATQFMRQQKFLKKLLSALKSEPELVQERLTKVRDAIVKPENLFVHIAYHKEKLGAEALQRPWHNLVPNDVIAKLDNNEQFDVSKMTPCRQLVNFVEKPMSAVIPVGSADSTFMCRSIKSISSFNDPDLPALQVLLNYLCQLEGPLWKSLRGLGLTYHYNIHIFPGSGLMQFLLYKATHVVAAHEKAVEIVNKYLDGEEQYEDNLFESAKSSLVFEYIKDEKSPSHRAQQSLVNYLTNLDIDYNRQLVDKVLKITKDDLRGVGTKYLRPLFDTSQGRNALCCNPSKVDEILTSYAALQCHFTKMNLETEPFLNSLEGADYDEYAIESDDAATDCDAGSGKSVDSEGSEESLAN